MEDVMRTAMRTLAIALTLTVAVPAARAQAPNFTGTWEMDAARSNFGQLPAPSKITLTVQQSGTATMKVTTLASSESGETTTSSDYTIDGKAVTVTSADGPQTNVPKWDGATFLVATKMTRQGADLTMTSRWALSPDGKALTIVRHMTTPMGDVDMKIVFNRKS
jgi:hypothetical protein